MRDDHAAVGRTAWTTGVALALGLLSLGCDADTPSSKEGDNPAKETKTAETSRKMIGKNVFFETQGDQRRVLVETTVCLRQGQLEGLLTRKQTKEHEYILAVDCDARHIHAALLGARAKPGSPVKFEPKYEPATGSAIKITLQYEEKGKLVSVPASKWIRNTKTKKDLDVNWVFAGSQLAIDPNDKQKPPMYLANHGDIICVCNIEDAMLDLPVQSTKSFDDRVWEANTDRIPALDTKVTMILEPIPDKGKDKEKEKK
jgi:hypothetical protein